MMGGALSASGVPQALTDTAEAAGFLDLFEQAPEGPGAPLPASPIPRIDVYPTHHHSGYALRVGVPFPFGATPFARGINFAVFSRHAVSLWLVQDETTARLMDDWYGRLRDGEGRATALRAAQRAVKRRHPHPYYWAPFVLIGRR